MYHRMYICGGNCVNPKYRFYLFIHTGFIEFFGLPNVLSLILCIPLSHYYISVCIIRVAVSFCPLKSFRLRLVFFFSYLNDDDATLAHSASLPTLGEGAYAIMIIIIKKILMCLVFATQLLIMAWVPCRGREASRCQNGQCASTPPPTCPEVSGSVEVTPTCLRALCRAGGGTGNWRRWMWAEVIKARLVRIQGIGSISL